MEKKSLLTRILSIVGTVLAFLPIAAPFVFAVIAAFTRRRFLFDYLMPAEIFFIYLAGALLLIWAALRKKSRRKLLFWSIGAAVVLLAASMGVAAVSGLASGRIEAEGIWWILTLFLLVSSELAMIATGVGGILLTADTYKGD